ncbi:MAG TPA: phage holin family protein [Burkholderiales bacterium]|nr:phage holin family protein [Burkholderiales bacterium]
MALNAKTPQPASPGLLVSLRRAGSALAALLHSRFELFTRELQRERILATRLLIKGVMALFFFALGMLTLTLFVIVMFWDTHRLEAIGGITLVYLAVAVALALSAKGEAGRVARPFASTLAELKKDREHFHR